MTTLNGSFKIENYQSAIDTLYSIPCMGTVSFVYPVDHHKEIVRRMKAVGFKLIDLKTAIWDITMPTAYPFPLRLFKRPEKYTLWIEATFSKEK